VGSDSSGEPCAHWKCRLATAHIRAIIIAGLRLAIRRSAAVLGENELRERRWGFAHLLSLMVKWGAIYNYHSNLHEICIQDVSRLAFFMHLYLLCNCIHFLVNSM
jgi:hypothetical protein